MLVFSSPLLFLVLESSLLLGVATALSPAEWRNQSIYQIVTDRFARSDASTTAKCDPSLGIYCGGSWRGILDKLGYIQGMGFTAIWISPVVENLVGDSLDGEAYHGYWAQDIYQVNANFGTSGDLLALSDALHDRGMYLMVDVVTNHMGYLGGGYDVDYSRFYPFNEESHYHPFCLINYDDDTSIKQCWEGDNTVSLPDLKTEDATVASIWNSWVSELVSNYSIDGLRIDSVREVDAAFFPSFQAAAADVHVLGEVYDGDPSIVCPYQDVMSGVLNYPQYYWVTEAFQSPNGDMSNLVNGLQTMNDSCSDTTLLGQFLENTATAFTFLSDGTPIIYYGQEQLYAGSSDTNCGLVREALWFSDYNTSSPLYAWIAAVNQIRNQAVYKDAGYVTYHARVVYSDAATIVLRKGTDGKQVLSVFTNAGSEAYAYILGLNAAVTGYEVSTAIREVLSCVGYMVGQDGVLSVEMADGLPRVFYPDSELIGSGICGL